MTDIKDQAMSNFEGTELEGKTEEEIYLMFEKYIGATIRRKFSGVQYIKNKHKLEQEDLFSFGCEGLISAIRTYNKESGSAFRTHVMNCIKWKIQDGIKMYSLEDDEATMSLNTPYGSEEDGMSLIDTVENKEQENETEFYKLVSDFLKNDEEVDEIFYYIVTEGLKGKTLSVISRELGMGRSSITERMKNKKGRRIKERLIWHVKENGY